LVTVHLCVEVAADDAGEFQKNWIDELEPPWFWQWARHRLPRSIRAVLSRHEPDRPVIPRREANNTNGAKD
jgi:hypothetical protein